MNIYRHPGRPGARIFATLCWLWLAGLSSPAATTVPPADLEGAIAFLLSQTLESNAIFIRNGEDHTAAEAVEHMQKKYQHFRKKGWIKTPEDFIRLAATRSLLSGKDYELKLPDGSTCKTGDWLTEKLTRYRAQQVGP